MVFAGALFCGTAGAQVDLGTLRGIAGKGSASSLTSDQATAGLKEALTRGVSTAVTSTGRPGGYFENAAIKILLPSKLQRLEPGMRAIGMGPQIDAFVKSMNKAAEDAAPAAKAILMNALQSMTIMDAKGIVTGGKTAGTEYFKRTTTAEIQSAFRPIVERQMAKAGVTQQFDDLLERAPKLPFAKMPTLDVNQYVLDKATDGLFVVMGQEETKIRTNPAAQTTSILRTVFGGR